MTTAKQKAQARVNEFKNGTRQAPANAEPTDAPHPSKLPPNAEQLVDDELDERTFTNYTEVEEKVGGKAKKYRIARGQAEIAADLLAHTDNWPRNVAKILFAFNPNATSEKQRYIFFREPPELFSWIKDRIPMKWAAGNGGGRDDTGVNFQTMKDIYDHLNRNGQQYEGISRAPHWPPRRDQFYDYGELPPPSDGHRAFWQLIDFFCLADETYRLLTAAFFIAPLYARCGSVEDAIPQPLPRPQWIIDTVDAQASGKSTLAKKAAILYGAPHIRIEWKTLKTDPQKILQRILSTDGRKKRVALVDNATGIIEDQSLASWVTESTLSGDVKYVGGDPERPNDITWVVTVNGAEIDTDTATRSYIIKVRKPGDLTEEAKTEWEQNLDKFIAHNRRQLYADMLDMLDHAKPRHSGSRFPDFDATVLSAVCDTDEQYADCRARIEADATGANVDAELADDFTEAVEALLCALREEHYEYDPTLPTLLTNAVIKKILDEATGKLHEQSTKQIRTMLKSGLAPTFSKKNPRLNKNDGKGGKYPEGIIYGVHRIGDGATETAFQIVDLVPTCNGSMRYSISHSTGTVKMATLIS